MTNTKQDILLTTEASALPSRTHISETFGVVTGTLEKGLKKHGVDFSDISIIARCAKQFSNANAIVGLRPTGQVDANVPIYIGTAVKVEHLKS